MWFCNAFEENEWFECWYEIVNTENLVEELTDFWTRLLKLFV